MNNIHFVDLHVFDVHNASFAIPSQGRLVKIDATLRVLIGSLVWSCSAQRLPIKWSTLPLKAKQPVWELQNYVYG